MTVIAFLLLVLLAAIAFLNMETIALNLFFISVSLPLWALILAAALAGMLIAALFSGATRGNARARQEEDKEELRLELEQKEKELETANKEKETIANKVRQETEMEFQMQQKEEEIDNLYRRIALMEEQNQNYDEKNSNESNPTNDEVIIIPATDQPDDYNESYPNSPTVEPETLDHKEDADLRDRKI